jgi:hypothetical protein
LGNKFQPVRPSLANDWVMIRGRDTVRQMRSKTIPKVLDFTGGLG